MRGSIHLALLALATLLVACTSPVDVLVDSRADFSRYHTWTWLPGEEVGIDAPGSPAAELASRVHASVERVLRVRGFERGGAGADFFVSCRLTLRRREGYVQVPFAPYLFSSLDSSASYWIEGSSREIRSYHDLRLEIGIHTAPGAAVWRATTFRSVEVGRRLPVREAVEVLLEHLPQGAPESGSPKRRSTPEPPSTPPESPRKGGDRLALLGRLVSGPHTAP